jgi:hypothetical protein
MGQLRLLGEPPGSDDHAALANLAFPQAGHTGFVAAEGLAGGQTIIGGAAAGEHLTLQSTVHATRGYVRAQDDLQLLSNVVRDSGGTERLKLAGASPHLLLTGDSRINGWAAIRSAPAANQLLTLAPSETWAGASVYMIRAQPAGTINADLNMFALSLSATPAVASGRTVPEMKGIAAAMVPLPTGTISDLAAVEGVLGTAGGSAPGAITVAHVFSAAPFALGWYGRKPATLALFDAPSDCGHASIPAVYGLRIANQSGVTVRLLELGPATPYLRLEGGAAPGPGTTKLSLNVGGTLQPVTAGASDSGGAGYRVLRVPN